MKVEHLQEPEQGSWRDAQRNARWSSQCMYEWQDKENINRI